MPTQSTEVSRELILKTAAILLATLVALPFSLILMLIAWLRQMFWANNVSTPTTSQDAITVLINGASMNKALDVARTMHKGGHRVIMVELNTHVPLIAARFSRAVAAFYRVPDPTSDYKGYVRDLCEICTKENVKLFIPVSPVATSYHDALVGTKLAEQGVESFFYGADLVRDLDQKYPFISKCKELGLRVPVTFPIGSKEEVLDFKFSDHPTKRFVLKRSNWIPDDVRTLVILDASMSRPEISAAMAHLRIGERDPFVLQEFVKGQELATYSVVQKGEVKAYCCVPSKDILLEYAEIAVPEALEFTKKFVAPLRLTGHISFDFILPSDSSDKEGGERVLLPIECNPRCHTAICLFRDHPWLSEAYWPTKKSLRTSVVDDEEELVQETTNRGVSLELPRWPIMPLDKSMRVYWVGHAIYDVLFGDHDLLRFAKLLLSGTEGFFSWDDPIPFLAMYHLQLPCEAWKMLHEGKNWKSVNISTSKLWM